MKNILSILITSVLFTGLAHADQHTDKSHLGHRAVVVVQTTNAWQAPQSSTMGTLVFEELAEGVRLKGKITGLEPKSKHGFHIHEFGDLSAKDGTSAGGHFNPHSKPHAAPEAKEHHAGDLGNIVADENGEVEIDKVLKGLRIDKGPHAVLGRAVVIHAGADDLKSQPSGSAGPRIGVGVIGWGNPETVPEK